MQLPAHIFPEIIEPGQVLADLHSSVTTETVANLDDVLSVPDIDGIF